jgi:DNA-binding MarR family transcriptional regulator
MIKLNRTFLGRLSEQLSDLIEQQSAEVFARAGIVIPVRSSSLLTAIATLGPVSAADLVRALELGLVSRRPNPDDQRVILIEITDKGRRQLTLLDRLDGEFERAYAEMEQDAGPVFDSITRAIAALKARPLIDRMDL